MNMSYASWGHRDLISPCFINTSYISGCNTMYNASSYQVGISSFFCSRPRIMAPSFIIIILAALNLIIISSNIMNFAEVKNY